MLARSSPHRARIRISQCFLSLSGKFPAGLNGLDFHLRAGERVALIGENGEGKTTLVKLMTRLYDPVEGQVLLDGVDLREYDLEDLYREIGVIFQDFMRYEMTARENIAVGRIDQSTTSPSQNTQPIRVWPTKSSPDFPAITSKC
jgi:ATP-binding cassette, subfamily B, bacterial